MLRLPASTLALPLSLALALGTCLGTTKPAADGRGQTPVFSNGSQEDTSRAPDKNATSTEGLATRPSTTQQPEIESTSSKKFDYQDHLRWIYSPEMREFRRKEYERISMRLQIVERMSSRNLFDWSEFCREAAVEEDEPIFVNDGSPNPRFEEVPGVGVYRFHARARTWAEARKVCELEGATLAVPNSHHEAVVLAEIHNRCPQLPTHFDGYQYFEDFQYVGIHDDFKEGRWETINGYPLNETGYEIWGRNQPDNAHFRGENCLAMSRFAYYYDLPCWTELPFICEHP